jgi:hypothetical protein
VRGGGGGVSTSVFRAPAPARSRLYIPPTAILSLSLATSSAYAPPQLYQASRAPTALMVVTMDTLTLIKVSSSRPSSADTQSGSKIRAAHGKAENVTNVIMNKTYKIVK